MAAVGVAAPDLHPVLDLRSLREDPDRFRAALGRRSPRAVEDLDRLLELDAKRRELTVRVEDLRARKNRGSKAIGSATDDERDALIAEVRSASGELDVLEPQLADIEEAIAELLARVPNPPHDSVPQGADDEDNDLVREVGEPPQLGFEPRDHVDLGTGLGIIDLERAAKVSGARFTYLLGAGVLLELALVRYCLDRLMPKGFQPVIPPVLVREEAMFGTGFLPTDEAQIYVTREDDLYLVGTSEVPLAGLHQGELLDPGPLPRRYAGYSTCFRREAGAYGKDTRGIFRVHQFDKVEMFSFTEPDASWEEHEFLLSCEEELIQGLELPYRVMNVCTGELGASAAKKYDIEVWLPGQARYRELTSCSNTTDYQARRLECRVRYDDGNRPAHTLNGTACAVGRTLIALLENHQAEDGSVRLPAALHPYLPETMHVLEPA
jgi:seryl-tRNA synthetase